jgi:hypothetical protein
VPILECQGVFEVVLPEGWRAWEHPGPAFDVSPDRGELGINITILDPPQTQSSTPDDLVRRFAQTAGLPATEAEGLQIVTPDDPHAQRRHFTSFTSDGRAWFVGLLMFPGGTIIATSNCPATDRDAASTGERLIASIAPQVPRSGLRRIWSRGRP